MKLRWKRVAYTVAGGLGILWVGMAAMLYTGQDGLLYHPGAAVDRTPASAGMAHEDLQLRTEDGETLQAWWIPADSARGTVLFFHGNAGSRAGRIESIQRFHDLGMNVLIVDYRGYGGSTGSPGEEGTYADARATWEAALEHGADPATTVIFGRSMGGPIAAHLAAERPAAGLILESTFSSLPDLASDLYPLFALDALVRVKYPTLESMERFAGPVLVLHSPEDTLIPFVHGERLREAAGDRGTFVELRGDHNTASSVTGQPYVDGLREFLDQTLGE